MKKVKLYSQILWVIITCLTCLACNDNQHASKGSSIKVATAANVQFAMKEIEAAFEAAFDVDISIIIGSSGKLTAQIKQGAPYDLLISADMKYPKSLYQENHATTPPIVYALGGLVMWTMKSDIQLDEQLAVLVQKRIHKIAIANPKTAPYGEQAMNAFQYFGIKEAILSKLVYAENVAQVNQYTITKNCEVGITAKSVVLSPEIKDQGTWIELPSIAYQPITQGVVITKYGTKNHKEMAQRFYDFLFSSEARQILEKYGYIIPNKE